MRDTNLMQLALGLGSPWRVKACTFDAEARRLDIEIDFARGGRFPCPACARAACPVHDASMQKWRHLDFFQHEAFLHARTPRITCPDCGVKQISATSRPGSASCRGRIRPAARCGSVRSRSKATAICGAC